MLEAGKLTPRMERVADAFAELLYVDFMSRRLVDKKKEGS